MNTLVARFQSTEENYIAISLSQYGKYVLVWCDRHMKIIKYASLDEWIWATTWGTKLEHGSWVIPDTNFNIDMSDIEECNVVFPVKVDAKVVNLSDNFVMVNLIDTDVVYIGTVNIEGDFVSNVYNDSPPCNINGETTIEVWESLLKNNLQLSYYKKTLYFKNGLPNPITKLEKLAVNRLLEDNISSYLLLNTIRNKENNDYTEPLEDPIFFLDHDEDVFNFILNSITKGDYSLLYSLIYKPPTIDRYNNNKTKERSTIAYYSDVISYFIYKMTNEELECMFKNAKILDMNSIIYVFVKCLYLD